MKTKVFIVGGYSRSLINFRGDLLQEMVAADVDVVATASEPDNVVADQLTKWEAHYEALPFKRSGFNPWEDLCYYRSLAQLMHRDQYNVVLAYTHKPIVYAAIAAGFMRNKPRFFGLVTGLGYAFIGKGPKSWLARQILSLLYRKASRNFSGVFFQNRDDLALFLRLRLIRPETPVCIVRGSGIDLSQFEFIPLVSKNSVSLAPEFLLIARLLGDKGIREYIAAARIIKSRYRHAVFHLIGPIDPNPNAIILAEVEGWQRDGTIFYHGSQQDVRPYLQKCMVYVLPSYREGTPRTVLEAMATGRAVITTDAPGCRETIFNAGPPDAPGVRTGENGMMVPIKSVNALVMAMERFIKDPQLAVTMGQAGRRLAEEYYDVHKVNRQMMEFMGLAAKPSATPDSEKLKSENLNRHD